MTSAESAPQVLWASALVLLIVALAQPRWGFVWEDVQREGVDIVVALDVSDSMLVADGEDSGRLTRLERARREISDLINLLDGDRISLVAFAGDAFIEYLLPWTMARRASSSMRLAQI